jgi:hypothetical protein
VVVPDWLPLTAVGALVFLDRVAEAADGVPLVLYNPPHAKTQVGPEQLADLARAVPALIGLKSAGGDAAWFDAVRESGLSLFVPGHFLASMTPLGADGSYSNVAALSPAGSVRWYELMQADHHAALDVERPTHAWPPPRERPHGGCCPNSPQATGSLGGAVHSTRESPRFAWAPKGQFLPGTSQAHGPGAAGDSEALCA